jgi:2-amino-4-hydroxy-6-hydroxymethyldihydropteridine diphosphokinase
MATHRTVRSYVGLGSNVGDAAASLGGAVVALAGLPGVRLRGVSRLYLTRPVGVVDQPAFHNAAVALDVPAGPDPASGAVDLLLALKALERRSGRRRRRRWGPRELDLDLLVFGRHRLAVERPPAGRSVGGLASARPDGRLLVVPHPDARERLFVLAPLADLAPGLVPPGWGESVASAARRRARVEGPAAVEALARWDATTGTWRALERGRSAAPRASGAPGGGSAAPHLG